jgi:hypothetical protein
MLRAALLAASVLFLGPALAQAASTNWFRAVNGMWVIPESDTNFYIPWNGEPGPQAFFCAAGDYVIRWLRLPQNTRIFRLSEPPRKAGEGIWFTLNPEGAASSTGITALVTNGPANSLSASASKNFCSTFFTRP